jgi:periplasmic divalent cation tolerance protein
MPVKSPNIFPTYNYHMANFIQIATTTATRDEAQQIARMLVDAKLAACAQIVGPVTSIYHWQGKVEEGDEWVCTLKTREDLFAKVETAIREVHSYQCPEIMATPIVAVSDTYLAWLERELTG